jgi:hypothetical protein
VVSRLHRTIYGLSIRFFAISFARIEMLCHHIVVVLCAWGANSFVVQRTRDVMELLLAAGHGEKLHCLGLNQDGSPKHPLYIAMKVLPIPYSHEAVQA